MIVDTQLRDGSGIRAVEAINRFGQIPHIFVCFDALTFKALKSNSIVLQKPYFECDLVFAIQYALRAAIS
jgi:hypothetical protein